MRNSYINLSAMFSFFFFKALDANKIHKRMGLGNGFPLFENAFVDSHPNLLTGVVNCKSQKKIKL